MQESGRCIECLTTQSDFYGLFKELRAMKIRELIKEKNVNIDESDILNNYDVDLQEIMEDLGFVTYCCRGHMTGAVDFYDYHKTALN